jgi:hypothetical protein
VYKQLVWAASAGEGNQLAAGGAESLVPHTAEAEGSACARIKMQL